MRIMQIELESESASADRLETVAYSLGVQGLEVVDESSGGRSGRVIVRLYLPEGAETDAAVNALNLSLPGTSIRTSLVPNADSWSAPSRPVRLGARFVVSRSTDNRTMTGRTRLLLDPAAAFGDGIYPTTRLVVEAMESHLHPALAL